MYICPKKELVMRMAREDLGNEKWETKLEY